MNFSDTQLYRRLLLALRAHLRGEINLLVDIALDVVLDGASPSPQDVCRSCRPAWHVGTARTMKRYIERLIEAKERALALVENALGRMDAGSYGICRHCGAALTKKQLTSAPHRTSCGACESQRSPELDPDWNRLTNRELFHR